ncbi:unnamed protein product, partial [Rotaria socialis]
MSYKTCSCTYLWRIERSPPSYIFGTIHVSQEHVWPYISKEIRQAFISSTHVYAEADLINMNYWDDFLRCVVNRTRRVERSTNVTTPGKVVDIHLMMEARRSNKTTGGLETPEYQCEKLFNFANSTIWTLIVDRIKSRLKNGTLGEPKMDQPEELLKTYMCSELDDAYMEQLWNNTEEFDDIDVRDENMSRPIHSLLKKSKKRRYFFAVGAGHVVGNRKHLIVRLKKYGYRITRICTYEKVIFTHVYAEADLINMNYWDDFLRCIANRTPRVERSTDYSTQGALLDMYLIMEARRSNKTTGGLETPEYLCEHKGMLANLKTWMLIVDKIKNRMKTGTFENETLNNFEMNETETLRKMYVCNEFDDEYIDNLENSTKVFHDIEQRDENISRRMHSLLKKSKKNRYFFAVGAGHLFGTRKNLIARLTTYGHKLTRLCTYQNLILKKFGCKKKKMMGGCIKPKVVLKRKKNSFITFK